MQKVLVLGATGAMGMYLVPELVSMGYQVDAVSLDERVSDHPNLTYIQANAKDMGFLAEILRNNYDAIVDFMVYHTPEFRERYMLLLESVRHYIYLSSYRVYADEQHPVTETAPRLLDVSDDEEFLATDDYSLHKARGENMLLACGRSNWTIVRPSIVYSKYRYQLVSLEAITHVYRMLHGKNYFSDAEIGKIADEIVRQNRSNPAEPKDWDRPYLKNPECATVDYSKFGFLTQEQVDILRRVHSPFADPRTGRVISRGLPPSAEESDGG